MFDSIVRICTIGCKFNKSFELWFTHIFALYSETICGNSQGIYFLLA